MLSLYAAMLHAGIPMVDIDKTDLHRYLRVLAFTAKRADKRGLGGTIAAGKNATVELHRGTIDEIW